MPVSWSPMTMPWPVYPMRPHLGRADVVDAVLDGSGRVAFRRWSVLDPLRRGVRLDDLHVRAIGQVLDERPVALGHDDVRDPERLVGNVPRAQHRAERRLRAIGVLPERFEDVVTTGSLVLHAVGGTHIRLIVQVDDERCFSSVRGLLQDFLVDLFVLDSAAGGVVDTEQHGEPDGEDRQRGRKDDSPSKTQNSPPKDRLRPAH